MRPPQGQCMPPPKMVQMRPPNEMSTAPMNRDLLPPAPGGAPLMSMPGSMPQQQSQTP